MDAIRTYLDAHKHSHLDALKEILRVPSVSTSPEHAGDVQALAEHLRNHLESIGLKKATVHSTPGHPIVTAEWLHAP
ncbi:MAG: peptidase M20, partial [Bacteroidetes bacterium]|nr:peptidase M20 [Bacteroidota bacterium]